MSCDERPQATRGQDRETQELAESLTNSKKWVSILDPGVFFSFFPWNNLGRPGKQVIVGVSL